LEYSVQLMQKSQCNYLTLTNRISQVPAYTKKDEVLFKSVSFEIDHGGLSGLFFVDAKITRSGASPLMQQNRIDYTHFPLHINQQIL
jgi:hypothetical protein